MRARLLLFVSLIGASGCFPYRFTTKPPVTGRVFDARTGGPLPGACVRFEDSEQAAVTTAADGSFALAPEMSWGVWFMLPPDQKFVARVIVTADGFARAERKVASWGGQVDLKEPIPLEPAE